MRQVMRAVCSLFLSLFFVWSAAADPVAEVVAADGCIAYEDTPICYRPNPAYAEISFEYWVVESIQTEQITAENVCVVNFRPVTLADAETAGASKTLAQQIYFEGTWMPWMDFNIQQVAACPDWQADTIIARQTQ